MKNRFYFFLILLFLISPGGFSQGWSLEFLKDTTLKGKQYIRLIFHADSLYKSRNFQKAIDVYNEAYALKPKEQYPRFKAEDIRTLYMKKDIVKIEKKQEETNEYAWAKRHREKMEREEKKKLIAEGKYVEKKKETTVLAANENKENKVVKKETVVIEEKKESKKDPVATEEKKEFKTTQIDEKTKKDEEARLIKYKELKAQEETDKKKKADEHDKAKENIEVKTEKNIKPEKEIVTISDVIIQKSREEEQKRIYANVSISQDIKPEDEQKLLAAKYPREKTIETITEKTKTTTQVIINKGGIVTIYLKVAHNWGQVFYFVKEPSSQMKSISRDYFERFTR